jgi:AMMECR1 domain-containing protein
MKQSYMEEQQRVILQVTIATNLSKWYGLIGNYEKAIEIANEGIVMCKKFKLGNALPNLLYGVAWNKERLLKLGILSLEDKRECLMYLKQAYYIASAMQLSFMEEFVEQHIATVYNIPID